MNQKRIKVAFVVPYAYEYNFQYAKHLYDNSEKFEEEIISKKETWHINWCKAMRQSNMDVTIYHISSHAKSTRNYVHKDGFLIKRFPSDFKLRYEYSFKLLYQLKKDKPDFVFSVSHMLDDLIDMYDVLSFFCKINGIRLISRNASSHSLNLIFRNYINYKELLSSSLKRSSLTKTNLYIKMLLHKVLGNLKLLTKYLSLKMTYKYIVQTDYDYNESKKYFKLKDNLVFMLEKPIDLSNFYNISKNNAREKLNLKINTKYLLHVSHLVDSKGVEHIINILEELNNNFQDVILIITGNGKSKQQLIKLAHDKNVYDKCIFYGHADPNELVFLYNAADVFVLPTKIQSEGQPNVIIEAIACNTPVITTNLPGPSSIVKEGLGLLADVGDEEKLYESISKILNKDFKYDEQIRNEIISKYSYKSIEQKLIKIMS